MLDSTVERVGRYAFKKTPENYLGEGGFGFVYKGYDLSNPLHEVAVKTVASAKLKSRELKQLSLITCDYLVKLLCICPCDEITYVVMELCDGDLGDHLVAHTKLDLRNLHVVADNLARGYQLFQTYKIVHRDIKPQNILLQYDRSVGARIGDIRVAKFSDFGTSRMLTCDDDEPSNVAGTLQYMAPEVGANLVATQTYDYSADMWSIGCVLYECITGRVPFDENALCRLFLQVACKNYAAYKKPPLPKNIGQDLIHVTSALLDVDVRTRLTPNQFYSRVVLGRNPNAVGRLIQKSKQSKSYNCFTDDDLRRRRQQPRTAARWRTFEYSSETESTGYNT